MKEIYVKVTAEDRMRMQAMVLDRDQEDALAFVKLLLDRIEDVERHGMRSHLDH